VNKKIFAVLLLTSFAPGIYSQEFKIGGEIKTGVLMTTTEDQINPKTNKTTAGSKDDAGNGSGRFRLNMEYSVGNFGVKARLNMENWGARGESGAGGGDAPVWPYVFGYGNFLDDQLTLSIGKLGASPWGTGGPEMWREVETIDSLGGMRLEWKPNFLPGLNVGFVINAFDGNTDNLPVTDDRDVNREPLTFLHILQESVVGISYTHEFFMIRGACRFDSERDMGRMGEEHPQEGLKIVYRVEEHAIEKVLPGFSIWALGYLYGVGTHEENKVKGFFDVRNWLFFQYAPEFLTAQIRLGYDVTNQRQTFYVKPNLYGHLFNRRLTFGASYQYAQDFGDKVHPGSPYYFMEIEPLIQVNLTPNSYIAAAYNWRREYVGENDDHRARKLEPIKQTQWINVRVGMFF